MDWGSIGMAVGGAVKQGLLTAPETPKGQQDLFADEEKRKRDRADALWAAEQTRAARLQQWEDEMLEGDKRRQRAVDDVIKYRGEYSPTTPKGVTEVEEFEKRQNSDAYYRMGTPNLSPMNKTRGNVT